MNNWSMGTEYNGTTYCNHCGFPLAGGALCVNEYCYVNQKSAPRGPSRRERAEAERREQERQAAAKAAKEAQAQEAKRKAAQEASRKAEQERAKAQHAAKLEAERQRAAEEKQAREAERHAAKARAEAEKAAHVARLREREAQQKAEDAEKMARASTVKRPSLPPPASSRSSSLPSPPTGRASPASGSTDLSHAVASSMFGPWAYKIAAITALGFTLYWLINGARGSALAGIAMLGFFAGLFVLPVVRVALIILKIIAVLALVVAAIALAIYLLPK